MPFKPFSLAESIQSGQSLRANRLKLQAMEATQAKKQELEGLARMSTKPTYERAEGPPTREGVSPQIQVGEQYDPQANIQALQERGYTEEAANLSDQISKMNKVEREDAAYRAEEFAKLVYSAKDDPDVWNENSQIAVERGYITPDQVVPYSNDAWQTTMNQATEFEDLIKQYDPKAPKTRNIREGKEIVNQEWRNGAWIEVGRGPVSQQQINLRTKPSEQAAGKEFNRILDQANTAEDQLATVHKARALIPDIEEGKLEPIKLWAREWGDAIGVSVDVASMSDASAFRSVMKNAVLDGMKAIKGTASEADRKTVEDSVAALDNPELANKFLIDTAESLAKRNIERANFWDDWAAANEGSLLGARRAWSARVRDIPLIKRVGNKTYHYYKFKEQAIQANKAAFKDATEQEINDAIDAMWVGGR